MKSKHDWVEDGMDQRHHVKYPKLTMMWRCTRCLMVAYGMHKSDRKPPDPFMKFNRMLCDELVVEKILES